MANLPASRKWSDLTTAEFGSLDTERLVAVLPVSATEQHGPHLPVDVDAAINRAVVRRVLELLPKDSPVLVLPPIEMGLSPEHADFPGTLTLSAETMLMLLLEVGRSVARTGVRKLALLNTHGGQPQILDLVAQRLRSEAQLVVATMNVYRYWDGAGQFGDEEAANGIHAGAIETSIMLHIAPDAVRADRIADFPSHAASMKQAHDMLTPYGRTVGLGWQMQDINQAGAAGNATVASADAGAILLDQAADTAVRILQDLVDLDADEFIRRKPDYSS